MHELPTLEQCDEAIADLKLKLKRWNSLRKSLIASGATVTVQAADAATDEHADEPT